MSAQVEIGSRVRQALAESGKLQKELAELARLKPDAMSRSLAGNRSFSSVELALIAEALNVDLHWLITGVPDPLALRVAARHSYDRETRARSNDGRENDQAALDTIALAYRQAYAQDPSPTPDLPTTPKQMRDLLGEGFVPDFATRLETELGVDFIRVPDLSTAYSLRVGPRMIIATPARGNWWHANFSIAHELAHLALGHHDEGETPADHEAEANAFASDLLVPEWMVRAIDWSAAPESQVAELVWKLGVSTEALRIKIEKLGISPDVRLAHLLLGRMPGALRRFDVCFDGGDAVLGRLEVPRSPIDERMEVASQRRFPATLIARHRELVDRRRINPGVLSWMLQVDEADLEAEPPLPQARDELLKDFSDL